MKIAMIGHKHIPSREGGVEIVVEELSTRMAKLGYDVTCYNRSGKHTIDKKQKMQNHKIYKDVKLKKVITIDKKGLSAMTSSFFGSFKILFSKADIVHYHAEGPCVMIPIIKWFSKKKIIVTIHGLDWQRSKWGNFASKYIKFGEKMAVKYADEIIVLSKNVQEYFMNVYNRTTHFIPNGVNKPTIRNAEIIKHKYELEKDSYILFLARIVPEKGLHYLIEAFKQIKTDKKLVIAGGASHTNDYFNEIQIMADTDKRIIMTGFVQGEELEELYSNSYLYCLPSDIEGMPISLLEAISYGNNCLVSNIEENIQVIKQNDKYYATVFEKSNIEDLKNKLKDCLESNEKSNKEKLQQIILNKYNWNDVVEKTVELYKKER